VVLQLVNECSVFQKSNGIQPRGRMTLNKDRVGSQFAAKFEVDI